MKKVLLIAAIAVFGFTSVQAQEAVQTAKGKWLVEANTGFGESHSGDTSIRFSSQDGFSQYNIGLEGGYFIMDNLALKAGLGYGGVSIDNVDTDDVFSWKFGGKYYIMGNIPVGLDLNGSSVGDASPMWVGLQAGYAWFLGDMVSIEPGLRYGLGMNEDSGDGDFNVFSLRIGFALHF